jgi:hypothetical protein
VYSIQHYVIKFVSDLRHACGFLQVFYFSPPIKLTATIYTEKLFASYKGNNCIMKDNLLIFCWRYLIVTVHHMLQMYHDFMCSVYSSYWKMIHVMMYMYTCIPFLSWKKYVDKKYKGNYQQCTIKKALLIWNLWTRSKNVTKRIIFS